MRTLGTLMNPHELAITSMHQIGGGSGPGFDFRLKWACWFFNTAYCCFEKLRVLDPAESDYSILHNTPQLSQHVKISV